MKKHLLAVAVASAIAAPAMAQNVQVYGVLDNSVGTFAGVGANDKTIQGVFTGALSTPRIGFKGSEDLGGGLKAEFVLEAEILGDTGDTAGNTTTTTTTTALTGTTTSLASVTATSTSTSTTTTNFFNRAAFLKLSGSFGNVGIGRQNTDSFSNSVKYDPMAAGNVASLLAKDSTSGANVGDAYAASRLNNSVRYESPVLGGFKVSYHHGFGESTTSSGASRTTDISVNFKQGAFDISAGQQKENDTTGAWDQKSSYFAGMYNAGFATFTLGQFITDDNDATGKAKRTFVGAAVPLPNALLGRVGYISLKDDAYTGTAKIFGVRLEKAMSKRTTAYALYATIDNGTSGQVNLASDSKMDEAVVGTTNQDQSTFMVGVRHTF